MGKVEDLIPNLSQMSPEELREAIREIRRSRRQPKKKVSAAKKSATSMTKAKGLLDKLSPAEKRALLKKLTGE